MTAWMIMALVAIGPLFAVFDSFGDDEEEALAEEETPEVPQEPAPDEDGGDLLDRLQSVSDTSRGATTPGTQFQSTRGTDGDETFLGEDSVANFADFSGGADSVTGGVLNDTLMGGDGSDTVIGEEGDDVLFGAFRPEERADDGFADSLDGGAGDDALFLGGGDTATGGAGSDIFATVQDLEGNVTVTDFNRDEDGLVFERPEGSELALTEQTITDAGVVLALNSGATVTLTGLDQTLPPELIAFVEVTPLGQTTGA